MFGSLPLDPNNDWIKLSKLVPWREFDQKYAENFRSKKGQRAIDSRMALGALLIKPAYKALSDVDITKEIAMNPYLQYFLGLQEYRYECPFDSSMMTRFRQRITPEMLAWVNDQIVGRKAERDKQDKDDGSGNGSQGDENEGSENAEVENEGTMILDATCAPQNIRFPTDASLLNEAREKAEEIIDDLHGMGLSQGKKPRTYREKARRQYNSVSKSRKKTVKTIRIAIRQQLGYLNRDLGIIDDYKLKHPGCLQELPLRQQTMLQVIRTLYSQQEYMYQSKARKVADRIVSLSQNWVRPIVRGQASCRRRIRRQSGNERGRRFPSDRGIEMGRLQRKHYPQAVGGSLPEILRTLPCQSPRRQDFSYQRKPEVLQGAWDPPQRPETGKAIHGPGRS